MNHPRLIPPGGAGKFFRRIVEQFDCKLSWIKRWQGMAGRIEQARRDSRTGRADGYISETNRKAGTVSRFVADA